MCTNDEVLAARIRRLRNLGQRAKGQQVELGYNERLDALQASLLRVKLPHLDQWNDARREHATRYRQLLPPEARPVEDRSDSSSVYHVFAVRLEHRDAVKHALSAEAIETGVHYTPAVHQHRVWEGVRIRHDALPVSEAWAREELSLPMHPDLRADELDRVVAAVSAAVSG